MSRLIDYFVVGILGTTLIGLVAIICMGVYAQLHNEDKASDVMRSCADTGMYLHKGYAISCRVLIDGAHEQQEMKI